MARAGRPTRVAIAVAVAGLLVAGACGVPTHSGVIVDGPQVGEQLGRPDGGAAPPGPTTTDEQQFILDYLDAVGSYSGDAAAGAARAFMNTQALHPAVGQGWQKSTEITVVRPLGAPAEDTSAEEDTYTLAVQVVGQFDPDTGTLDPNIGSNIQSLRFVIDKSPHQLRFSYVEDGLFMTMTRDGRGLQQYYQEQIIYFWDSTHTRLIAEPRYVPKDLSDPQQEARIVNWILGGPSSLLNPAVSRPPSGVTLRDPTISTIDGHLVVNLSSGAKELGPALLRQLVVEIGWSFGPRLLTHPIELQIEYQRQFVMDPFAGDEAAFQAANLADERGPAFAFAISEGDGVVRPLVNSYKQLTGVLASPLNKQVAAAAINSDQRFAAFVRAAPDGRQALWIVQNGGSTPTSPVLTGRSITDPAWVLGPTDPPQLAVLVDGALVLVSKDGAKWDPQVLRPANTPPAPLTSFSVSPEGARIAFTAGGQLFVTTIVSQAGRFILSPQANEINLKPFVPDAVAWKSEIGLVVGGRDDEIVNGEAVNGTAIEEVNIDGENIALLKSLGFEQDIMEISAFPAIVPIGDSVAQPPPPVLGQAGNRAFQEYAPGGGTEVSWSDEGNTVTPTPGSSGSSGSHKLSPPINPFYAQ